MKLHIPLSLRSALMAVCAIGVGASPIRAGTIVDQPETFLRYRELPNPELGEANWQWVSIPYTGTGNEDSITFTGITGFIFYGWYHNQAWPIGGLPTPAIHFTNYGEVAFDGNTVGESDHSYKTPGVITSYYYQFVEKGTEVAGGILFENCENVRIQNNEGRLFGGLIPSFENVGTVDISNNTSALSRLLGNNKVDATFSNVTKAILINNNTVTGDGSLLMGMGLVATASGDTARVEIKGNQGSGEIVGLWSGTVALNNFAFVEVSGNKISDTTKSISQGVGEVAFKDVKDIVISDNSFNSSKGASRLLGGTMEGISSLTIENNTLGYNAETGSYDAKGGRGLFDATTITGNGTGKVFIRNNKSGSTNENGLVVMENGGAAMLKDLDEVEISGNSTGLFINTENVKKFRLIGNQKNAVVVSGSNQADMDHWALGVLQNHNSPHEWVFSDTEEFIVKNNTATSNGGLLGGAICRASVDGWGVQGEVFDMVIQSKTVQMQDNAAIGTEGACGGAIYGGRASITFKGCDKVSITGNYAQADTIFVQELYDQDDAPEFLGGAMGGAIMVDPTSPALLEFKDNNAVEIRGNYIANTARDTCQLNAIFGKYLDVVVKVKPGQIFECYDGAAFGELYINGFEPELESFLDKVENDESYTGTVLFSGKYAEEDLKRLNPKYTPKDLEKSKTVQLEGSVYVYRGTLKLEEMTLVMGLDCGAIIQGGTLELDHATLRTRGHFDWPRTYELDSVEGALVSMKNGSVLDLGDAFYSPSLDQTLDSYGVANLPTAQFTGANNIIRVQEIYAVDGTWTFNVTNANATDPILKIEFDPIGDSSFSVFGTANEVFDIQFDKSTLKRGKYKLLTYDSKLGMWNPETLVGGEMPSVSGMASSVEIGLKEGEGDVYLVADSEGIYTLYFDNVNDPVAPEHRTPTTLTWTGGDGKWGEGIGGETPLTWSAPEGVKDLNFYAGDKVVIRGNAHIELVGSADDNCVRPDEVEVDNKDGEEVVLSGQIGISDVNTGSDKTTLTKKGDGKLTLNTSNAYTGGTVIEGGELVTGHVNALGEGGVTLKGGTLNLNALALRNNIHVQGDASVNGGSAYAGKLVLESGTLSGALNLEQSAELKGGTVAGALSGKGGVQVSGAVTLNGANTYTGGTAVKSGTLTLGETGSVTGEVGVEKGASIEMKQGGTYTGNITLNEGSSLHSEGVLELGSQQRLTLKNGSLQNGVTLKGGTLTVGVAEQSITGNLTLDGGTLELGQYAPLTVDGAVNTGESETTIGIADMNALVRAQTQTLLEYTDAQSNIDLSKLKIQGLDNARKRLWSDEHAVYLELSSANLTWDNGKTGTWTNGAANIWESADPGLQDKTFHDLDSVTFNGAGDVEIQGEVRPASITVEGAGDTTFKNAEGTTGSIVGSASLTKTGTGVLDIQTDNRGYTGDITVTEGTLKAGNENALGTGKVLVNGATFDANNKNIVANVTMRGQATLENASSMKALTFDSGASVKSTSGYTLASGNTLTIGPDGSSYTGNFTFTGGTLTLTGGIFDLSHATVTFGEGTISVIDLSGWVGLEYGGEYTLLMGEMAVDSLDVRLGNDMDRAAHLEERDGEIVLVIGQPSDVPGGTPGGTPGVLPSLSRDQRNAYGVLAQAASSGAVTGTLQAMAEQVRMTAAVDPNAARALLDRLSGAELATAISSQTEGNMAHLRRLRGAIGSGQALSSDRKVGAYITSYTEDNRLEQDAQGRGYHRTEIGGTFGVETARKNAVVGAALSAGRTYVSPSGPALRYHEDIIREDLYFVASFGRLRSTTTVGLGQHEIDTRRTLPNGMMPHAKEATGSSVNLSEELAVTLSRSEKHSFESFFAVESSYNHIDAFHEEGADSASLNVDAHDTYATDLSLGLRANFLFPVVSSAPPAVLSVQGAAITSVGDTVTDVTMHYAGAPELPYSVRSAKRNRWGYSAGASLTVPVSQNAAIFGSSEAILRGDSHEVTATLGVKLTF